MIRWNEEYKVYVSDEGRVWNKANKELLFEDIRGYKRLSRHFKQVSKHIFVHRLVWETFMGKIPDNLQIDHFNRIRDDNRLSNLRCVSHIQNMQNRKVPDRYPITDFGIKFKEHFGIQMCKDRKLYLREWRFYKKYNKCSWE